MNFEDILKLVEDTTKTRYQLAADIHALISKATAPSALKVQPMKERKARSPNKAKEAKPELAGMQAMNGHDHDAQAS